MLSPRSTTRRQSTPGRCRQPPPLRVTIATNGAARRVSAVPAGRAATPPARRRQFSPSGVSQSPSRRARSTPSTPIYTRRRTPPPSVNSTPDKSAAAFMVTPPHSRTGVHRAPAAKWGWESPRAISSAPSPESFSRRQRRTHARQCSRDGKGGLYGAGGHVAAADRQLRVAVTEVFKALEEQSSRERSRGRKGRRPPSLECGRMTGARRWSDGQASEMESTTSAMSTLSGSSGENRLSHSLG